MANPYQVGVLEGRMTALERKVDVYEERLEHRLSSIENKLDSLTAALNIGRGGWKAALLLLSLLSGLVAFISGLVTHFWGRG